MGGNILNDLADRDLDRRAHPERALPSGAVRPRTAAGLVLALWLVALGAAALASTLVLFVAAVLMGLLVAYEAALKETGLPGNLVVAVVAGALFPLGAVAAAGAAAEALRLAGTLGALAALAHLGRELQKDAEDVAGDRGHRRTVAVRHGPRVAARAGAVALLAAVAVSALPHLVGGWGDLYLAAVAPAAVAFAVAAVVGLGAPARGRAWAKLAMVLALAAFAAGAWWG